MYFFHLSGLKVLPPGPLGFPGPTDPPGSAGSTEIDFRNESEIFKSLIHVKDSYPTKMRYLLAGLSAYMPA